MKRKIEDLRPVMTRLPEGLRRRLERSAGSSGRSMNAEIIHRLEQSFAPNIDPGLYEEVAAEILRLQKLLSGISVGKLEKLNRLLKEMTEKEEL